MAPIGAENITTCDDNRRSCVIYAVPSLWNGTVDSSTAFHTVKGSDPLALKQKELLVGQPKQTIYWQSPNKEDLKFSAGDWGVCGEVMSFVTLKETVLDGTICGPSGSRVVGKAFVVAVEAETFQGKVINKVIANMKLLEPCRNCQWMIWEIVKGPDQTSQQDVFNNYKTGEWGKLPETMTAD